MDCRPEEPVGKVNDEDKVFEFMALGSRAGKVSINMIRIITVCLLALLLASGMAQAKDGDKKKTKKTNSDAKELSGMSIVGNDEAPKSLYIVPWKSSEIGLETTLNSMLNEKDTPVDREVFKRQLDFYTVSKGKQ